MGRVPEAGEHQQAGAILHQEERQREMGDPDVPPLISRCKKLLNYCDYCCTEVIPLWERIIHWDCEKTCVRATRSHEKKLRDALTNPEDKPYVPKEGDLIDFQENKSKAYIPAVIKKITKNEEGI